jgi:hypothetical protein
MDKGESKDMPSITLLGCQAATSIDGSVALVFHTAEGGAIAFEVTLETLSALRQAIAAADEFLRRQPGHA